MQFHYMSNLKSPWQRLAINASFMLVALAHRKQLSCLVVLEHAKDNRDLRVAGIHVFDTQLYYQCDQNEPANLCMKVHTITLGDRAWMSLQNYP